MIRAIQIIETAKNETEAQTMLAALSDQGGWLGGRILPPTDVTPEWRVQGLVEDNPHAGNMWLPDGMRRVIVPDGLARRLGISKGDCE